MNLQGLWNDNNNPHWASDYHYRPQLRDDVFGRRKWPTCPNVSSRSSIYLQSQIPVWRYFTTNTSTSINNGGYGYGFGGTNGWAIRAPA